MTRPKWFVNLLIKTFHLRFLLARLTRIPIIRFIIDNLFFKDDKIYYLPKDTTIVQKNKTIQINKNIQTQIEIVLPSKIVHYFIEKANYHWIMNFCLCRTANKCIDYPHEIGCLFLGEAVLKIDKNLGKLVTRKEAHKHIKKCRELGMVHLIGRNKLDAQWLDAKPGNKLMTICNCCECCCLWKMIPDLDFKISRKITKLPGLKIVVTDNCIGCKSCLEDICFVNALSIIENKVKINQNICQGCGRCVEICKNDTIKIEILDNNYVQNAQSKIEKIIEVR